MAEPIDDGAETTASAEASLISEIIGQIIYSPLHLALVAIITFLIYKIIKGMIQVPHSHNQAAVQPELPKMRRDFTVEELKKYDGTQPDGRILVAVNGNVYDVTKSRQFYGPGGNYAAFGGRDASRCLVTFSVNTNDIIEYDDLSDLSSMEMGSLLEWEMQFKEKYYLVGRLLKPGEQPTNYSDEEPEDNSAEKSTTERPKEE